MVRDCLIRDQEFTGLTHSLSLSCNDSGQVVHTHVPLLPSSVIYSVSQYLLLICCPAFMMINTSDAV